MPQAIGLRYTSAALNYANFRQMRSILKLLQVCCRHFKQDWIIVKSSNAFQNYTASAAHEDGVFDGKRKKKRKGKKSRKENLDDLKREMEMVCFVCFKVEINYSYWHAWIHGSKNYELEHWFISLHSLILPTFPSFLSPTVKSNLTSSLLLPIL